MTVVIVGAKERDTEQDQLIVKELLELAYAAYPNCIFATMLTHMGVGMFVKNACLDKTSTGAFRYPLIEESVRVFAEGLSKAESSAIYMARNATLFELGDVFIYLAGTDRRGTLEELIVNRVLPAGRPCVVLLPGESARLP